eukprot:scpid75052/ scgid5037/ Probable proline dehydrogenase 2; Probable proline oxidase 2
MMQRKTIGQLVRAIGILRLCRYKAVVNSSEKIMELGRRFPSKVLFNSLMRHTVYSQFVAGKDVASLNHVASELAQDKVRCMLYVHVESDEKEGGSSADAARLHEYNKSLMLEAAEQAPANSMIQVKMTGIASVPMMIDMSNAMRTASMLPSSDKTALLEASRDPKSLAAVPEGVNTKYHNDIIDIQRRLHEMAEAAARRDAFIIIDAEQSYFQPAIQRLALPVMLHWNSRSRPVIYTTIQAYLKESRSVAQGCLRLFEEEKSRFAAKIVRGAYLKLEADRAHALGYSNPICSSYEETNDSYNQIVRFMFDKVREDAASLMVATHNVESITLVRDLMKLHDIHHGDGERVCFGQIYGLADHLTSDLAAHGYITYKSVPSGPEDRVLGYLARRAQENNAVFSRLNSELSHLQAELLSRLPLRST